MPAYRVDLKPILEELGGTVDVDRPYALDLFRVGEDVYTLVAPAAVDVALSNTGAGFVATGTVTADVTATCSRCLCEFPLHVIGDVEGFYIDRKSVV
jgi:uncharacterized metal-binding protein YceD (DUF177 family)